MQTTNSDFIDIMEKNHMEIPWHDYANDDSNVLIAEAGLIEKASVIGRVGLIMLSCGTGAWRVRTSMNRLSKELGVTCTVDVGLMSIVFNCFDGNDCISQSLSIANTGVNTSKLYRMEQFVDHFSEEEAHMTGEDIHKRLDEIEHIHYRKKASVVLALECLIVILSLVFHNILFLESIIFSQFTIAISLICGELKKYLQSDSLNGGKML